MTQGLVYLTTQGLVVATWVHPVPQNYYKRQMVPYAWVVLDMIKPSGDVQIMLFLLYSQFHLGEKRNKNKMLLMATSLFQNVEEIPKTPSNSCMLVKKWKQCDTALCLPKSDHSYQLRIYAKWRLAKKQRLTRCLTSLLVTVTSHDIATVSYSSDSKAK